MRSLLEFTVDSPQGSGAKILHAAMVNAGLIVTEGTGTFGSGLSQAMQQLEDKTNNVYGRIAAYKKNLVAQTHALPADPDHPLIWEVADQHLQDLANSATSADMAVVIDKSRRHFLLRNVLAILAQTPMEKRMLQEQLQVSVLHLQDEDCVGLMYWSETRSRVLIRLRQRNPKVLRKATQVVVTTIKKIGLTNEGNPALHAGPNGAISNTRTVKLQYEFEPVQLFTHSVGAEELIESGEVVQFDNSRSTYSFIWKRRVNSIAKGAIYATLVLSVGFFVARFFFGTGHEVLLESLDFASQGFGRLFTTALWVVFLQIFVEHGELLRALRSKESKFVGGAIVLWGEGKRYAVMA